MRDNIIFFDGICAMCNNFVLFVLRKDKNKQVLFMSLQSQKAKDILFNYGVVYNSDNLNTIYYLKNNKIYYYSDVIIELFININYLKKAAKIGRLIPKFLRDNIYK